MKTYLKIFAIALLGGLVSLGTYKAFFEPAPRTYIEAATQPTSQRPVNYSVPAELDFVEAAERTVHAVVHVKTASTQSYQPASPFEFFFGPQNYGRPQRRQMGSGSGVILSADGYIVTNNHVIENADDILIKLNNGSEYEAKLIGTDPTTDIALLKIDPSENLEYITFANSDEVHTGQWVLAVGNPFNLTSTVTAGIVSAKGRNIGIIQDQFAIESFIQTDAAVNPGNSGGALVNPQGKLVGINSAISSSGTGTYVGYSFAVPSNIVKKVVDDLKNYGTVQRAFLGVNITDVNAAIVDDLNLSVNRGVYVADLTPNGAAQDAGLEKEDVIIAINDEPVNRSSELQEIIGRQRPGDEVKVTLIRNNRQKELKVTLRNANGTTSIIDKESLYFISRLGGELRPLDEEEKDRLGLDYGVVVANVENGILRQQGIPEGFIITRVNGKSVSSPEDINKVAEQISPGDPIVLQGILPNGKVKYFAFGK